MAQQNFEKGITKTVLVREDWESISVMKEKEITVLTDNSTTNNVARGRVRSATYSGVIQSSLT